MVEIFMKYSLRPAEILLTSRHLLQKLLRQHVYKDVEQSFFTPPSRELADQCIEILRQQLVCTCDPTLYLMSELRTQEGTGPVLGNTHYCRNYDKVQEWSKKNAAMAGPELGGSILFSS